MKDDKSKKVSSKATCFIVFSDDWGEHPSSCQHIFKHIVKDHSVLWVNTIGMRTPNFTLYDFKKIVLKLRKMFSKTNEGSKPGFSTQKLTVIQPLMLPFIKWPFVRLFNKKSVIRAVRTKLKELGLSDPVMVITAPNACDYIGFCGESKVVYYCVDDFSEWPGLEKDLVFEMEEALIRHSDIFFATSQHLYEKIERQNKKVNLLTHGVDATFFANPPESEHYLLNEIPRPRIGYFGLFDDRSDQGLLTALAKNNPNIAFVITGNVETNINELEKLKNVYFTGSISYDELPAMAKGYDICMLPYKLNELTEAIQPLKIKEYIATGKPVISTPIKEALNLGAYISVAGSVIDWQQEIQKALSQQSSVDHEKREEFLVTESWEGKSALFARVVCQLK